eukprot:COSAG01_NODE_5827_length_4008_cov_63.399079_4_plen_75_part_00
MPKTRGAKSSSPQDSPGGGGAGEGQASSSSLPSPAPAPEAEPEEESRSPLVQAMAASECSDYRRAMQFQPRLGL